MKNITNLYRGTENRNKINPQKIRAKYGRDPIPRREIAFDESKPWIYNINAAIDPSYYTQHLRFDQPIENKPELRRSTFRPKVGPRQSKSEKRNLVEHDTLEIRDSKFHLSLILYRTILVKI